MKIVADTSALLSPEEGSALGITVIPVGVVVNGKAYRDLEEITSEMLLDEIKKGAVPTSSQPAIGDVLDVYEDGKEEILHLSIGDGLSGAYQNAMGARNCVENKERIHIIDTKTLAGPHRYLVKKAIQLKEQGLGIERIKEEILRCVESSVSFVIPSDFNFLKRCGRLTPLAAGLGNLVKIVPVMTQTEDKRRITLFSVKRSRKKALSAIVEHFKSIGVNENYLISICHGGAREAAEETVALMKQYFSETIVEMQALSPALLTHGGPGCVVIQAIRR